MERQSRIYRDYATFFQDVTMLRLHRAISSIEIVTSFSFSPFRGAGNLFEGGLHDLGGKFPSHGGLLGGLLRGGESLLGTSCLFFGRLVSSGGGADGEFIGRGGS